jgi:hypothetical protein
MTLTRAGKVPAHKANPNDDSNCPTSGKTADQAHKLAKEQAVEKLFGAAEPEPEQEPEQVDAESEPEQVDVVTEEPEQRNGWPHNSTDDRTTQADEPDLTPSPEVVAQMEEDAREDIRLVRPLVIEEPAAEDDPEPETKVADVVPISSALSAAIAKARKTAATAAETPPPKPKSASPKATPAASGPRPRRVATKDPRYTGPDGLNLKSHGGLMALKAQGHLDKATTEQLALWLTLGEERQSSATGTSPASLKYRAELDDLVSEIRQLADAAAEDARLAEADAATAVDDTDEHSEGDGSTAAV